MLAKSEEELENDDDPEETWAAIVNSGYQGIQHSIRAILPTKKKAGRDLTRNQRAENKNIASVQVICENYYTRLKTKFRIMAEKYRNGKEDYAEVFKLCSVLTNYHLIQNSLR